MSSLRLLINNALSPQIVPALVQAGHDVVHVLALGMGAARDDQILDHACSDG